MSPEEHSMNTHNFTRGKSILGVIGTIKKIYDRVLRFHFSAIFQLDDAYITQMKDFRGSFMFYFI